MRKKLFYSLSKKQVFFSEFLSLFLSLLSLFFCLLLSPLSLLSLLSLFLSKKKKKQEKLEKELIECNRVLYSRHAENCFTSAWSAFNKGLSLFFLSFFLSLFLSFFSLSLSLSFSFFFLSPLSLFSLF